MLIKKELGEYLAIEPYRADALDSLDRDSLDSNSLELFGIIHAAGGIIPECFFTAIYIYFSDRDPIFINIPMANVLTDDI